ncbi:hypothetical protein PPERSA_05304 [Pseudocohnilembus persalinus]|uniref:Uncharacterized protein n=1 Tax=Pseudocohnilembus persalinus TaxID=266149 RepID=A0A0V0R6X5_PSEPJ|nr:hypothetical protein PPERSA_05304 [Pseudocohnilembus persalinus]|eukprot:KRX09912.1 hypothetical protein PPERSA_05304 [Pseudocohnilembus persalinus]
MIGPEDLTKITENIGIFSQNDNIQLWELPDGQIKAPQGNFGVYYFETKTAQILEIQNKPQDFKLHTQGIYFDHNTQNLYAINHPYDGLGDRIEVFSVNFEKKENIQLTYKYSLQTPPFLNGITNDLIKISENELLITEWLSYPDELKDPYRANFSGKFKKFKLFFKSLFTNQLTAVYSCTFDNKKAENSQKNNNLLNNQDLNCIAQKQAYAIMNNGITWDKQNTVLIADTASSLINTYQINFDTQDRSQRLQKKGKIFTTRHPDNVEYDIYLKQYTTGGMGTLMNYFKFIKEQAKIHPEYTNQVENMWTFVDIIKPQQNGQFKLENVILRNNIMRGCSNGIQYKEQIVLTSFGDQSLMTCSLPQANPKKPRYMSKLQFLKSIL